MTALNETTARDDLWEELRRPLPAWFAAARFGIFIHWGAYSVPAWAEPTGALGLVPEDQWFTHNAYAEWYANTIRIEGSPAAEHHAQDHGGAPYDDFLDRWGAEEFDPAEWARLFRSVGAAYVIPTTKHHDGIALWDAPGTGTRNTVHRGPRRDLVGAVADAVRAEGMRFGVYYSGGLDWHVTDLPPHTREAEVRGRRPNDPAYAAYAFLHVQDLVDRYAPDVLWNDIEWPDAGKRRGGLSLHALFRSYYQGNPDGVVNDRWGDTHRDFRTSEYSHHMDSEAAEVWENCRGVGFSFGYNQAEGAEVSLDGGQLAHHLTDVVSRGGRFLLNVGPTAAGTIPEVQRRSLQGLAAWTEETGGLVHRAGPLGGSAGSAAGVQDQPWVRWLESDGQLVAAVGSAGRTDLRAPVPAEVAAARVVGDRGRLVDGERLAVEVESTEEGPVLVVMPRSR